MALLSSKQQSKLAMFHSNDSMLEEEKLVFANYPAFKKHADNAQSNLIVIDNAIQTYQTSKHGDVELKVENKMLMAKASRKICGPMLVFSKDENHTNLKSIYNFSKSDIFKMRDIASLEQCRGIIKETNKWTDDTGDYMIYDTTVLVLTNACDAFEQSLDIVSIDKDVKISIYDHITNLFNAQDESIDSMKNLSIYYEDVDNRFLNRFNASIRIIDVAHKYINLKVKVIDADTKQPIYQAVAKLHYNDELLETKSSKKGNFQYKELESGLFQLDIEHFAYDSYTTDVELYNDKTLNITIELQKKVD